MKKPIVAFIYDFDNTLSTKDMQEFCFIPALGMTADEFWGESDGNAHKYKMDHILSYMMLTLNKAKQKGIDISYEGLKKHGQGVEFFDGVLDWFDRINKFGESLGLEVRHYIISCGLKPMIEGCEINKHFHNIFACDYVYGEDGQPIWPSVALNYTSKTQFLYRINKGVEELDEDKKLNMYMPANKRAVSFENMIYVGDGLTDIPSMKLTRQRGGYAIGVYRNHADGSYLIDEKRVDFYVKADYTEGSEMDKAAKAILTKISASEAFEELSQKSCKKGRKQPTA